MSAIPTITSPTLSGRDRAGKALAADNISLPRSISDNLFRVLVGVGLVLLLLTLVGAFAVRARHAMAAYLVGLMTVLAVSLGGMFFTMIFHIVNAGWCVTLRRQFENLAGMMPVVAVLSLPFILGEVASSLGLIEGGMLMQWITQRQEAGAGIIEAPYLLEKKAAFLNVPFWLIRCAVYLVVWVSIAKALMGLSVKQDATGDVALSRKLRYMSGWGLLAFALTTAFVAFDWMMALDYRFFSTMWGVWYFAGAALSSLSCVAIIAFALKTTGRLDGAVTKEHFHDLAKLMFGFTVFWAYISYSQYFLIWYSNIPEETAFFVARKENGWQYLYYLLAFGHFVVPFLILIFRPVKKAMLLVAVIAAWLLLMQVADMVFVIRPVVYVREFAEASPGLGGIWLDAVGILGVIAIYTGLLIRSIGRTPLIPTGDPRLNEALHHKNYV